MRRLEIVEVIVVDIFVLLFLAEFFRIDKNIDNDLDELDNSNVRDLFDFEVFAILRLASSN